MCIKGSILEVALRWDFFLDPKSQEVGIIFDQIPEIRISPRLFVPSTIFLALLGKAVREILQFSWKLPQFYRENGKLSVGDV